MACLSPASISPAGATTAPSCSSTSRLTGSPSAALRLPQVPLRQQFALIAPHLAGLDLLVFDQSGLGDAAAELLPKTPPHVGVCLIGGDRPLVRSAQGDRLVVGKSWLIQRLGAAMREWSSTPRHGGAEPLDQPRLANDQAVLFTPRGRFGQRSRCRATPTCGVVSAAISAAGIAEAALIENEEVEAGEVRCDEGELLAQRNLRQAQRSRDGEPVSLDVEEHEGAVGDSGGPNRRPRRPCQR